MPIEQITAAVDLGKSRCRLAVIDQGRRTISTDAGSPGLATPDGVSTALAAILPLLARAPRINRLGIGAAGAWSAADAAEELARRLAVATGAHVAVTSDVVTAHVGALGGSPGTLLIAGTGAAALGVDADGVRLVDGWGPEIGDFGSGSWIGREGVRATLRVRDGLGPATALTEMLRAHIFPSTDAIAWLAADIPVARQLATVAPLVLDAAAQGDGVAAQIVAEAVRLLTASAVAASGQNLDIAIHGGLAEHGWFRGELERSLVTSGRSIVSAVGDAFDGAALIADRTDTPHERFVHRAR